MSCRPSSTQRGGRSNGKYLIESAGSLLGSFRCDYFDDTGGAAGRKEILRKMALLDLDAAGSPFAAAC